MRRCMSRRGRRAIRPGSRRSWTCRCRSAAWRSTRTWPTTPGPARAWRSMPRAGRATPAAIRCRCRNCCRPTCPTGSTCRRRAASPSTRCWAGWHSRPASCPRRASASTTATASPPTSAAASTPARCRSRPRDSRCTVSARTRRSSASGRRSSNGRRTSRRTRSSRSPPAASTSNRSPSSSGNARPCSCAPPIARVPCCG